MYLPMRDTAANWTKGLGIPGGKLLLN